MRWKGFLIAVPVLAIALIVVLAVTKPRSSTQDTLVWARSSDCRTLDPAEIEWGEDVKVAQNIYETLVAFDKDSVDLVPGLASHWKIGDDLRMWFFTLKQGVTFHDGTPLTAEAVAFTFQRLIDKDFAFKSKLAPPYGATFEIIESVDVEAKDQVSFRLRQPSATFLHVLAMFGAGIVSPEAVKKHRDRFPRHPVGTGPYRMVEWKADEKIVLERFENYHGTKPPVRRVIVLPVQSPQTAIQKLKNREVHVVDHPTLADIKPLQEDPSVSVDFEGSMNVCYLGFNMKRPPYDDVRFRCAVALAIDRKALNALAYYGLAEPARFLVPPSIWKETEPEYEHNPEKAKKLLAEVPIPSGPVELWHMTYARPYAQEPHRVAEFIKESLRKIGLEVRLQGFDINAYSSKIREKDHPMYLMGWSADYADPDNFLYTLLHKSASGETNNAFFEHEEFSTLVAQAQSELNSSARKEIYRRAARIYQEEIPTLPLVHVRQMIAFQREVDYNLHPIEYRFYKVRFKE